MTLAILLLIVAAIGMIATIGSIGGTSTPEVRIGATLINIFVTVVAVLAAVALLG